MQATPLLHWIGFHLLVLVLLGVELVYSRWRGPGKIQSTAVAATVLWVVAALGIAEFVLHTLGSESAVQYLAGYAIEESLSIDNLFVFLLLFRIFRIDPEHQPKVLFWGVAGAIVMRGAFIAAGLGLMARFHWISYLFAAVLLFAAVRLLMPGEEGEEEKTPRWIGWISRLHPVSLRQDKFFVREDGQRMMTMLFLALLAIEVTDVVFALDSIPAVLSITRHPFIAYTSNIMAVMGLRSLYFLLAHLLSKLRFLHYGLAGVLAFAAIKMLAATWIDIGPIVSLAVIVGVLGMTIGISIVFPGKSRSVAATSRPVSTAPGDAELATRLARLWPHREHESNATTGLCCRIGLHRWRQLDLEELVPGRNVRFCFWCSKVRIDGVVYDP